MMKKIILILILILASISIIKINYSTSYYTDNAKTTNSFTAGTWETEEPLPTVEQ